MRSFRNPGWLAYRPPQPAHTPRSARRRVADLVATGRSNREVAAALVVATRTVPAGEGANQLVLNDVRKALPAGSYRLEIRQAGRSQTLARKSLTIPRHP